MHDRSQIWQSGPWQRAPQEPAEQRRRAHPSYNSYLRRHSDCGSFCSLGPPANARKSRGLFCTAASLLKRAHTALSDTALPRRTSVPASVRLLSRLLGSDGESGKGRNAVIRLYEDEVGGGVSI